MKVGCMKVPSQNSPKISSISLPLPMVSSISIFSSLHLADFVLALAFEVVSGLFLDGFRDGQTAVGSFEANALAVYLGFCAAVYGDTDAFSNFSVKLIISCSPCTARTAPYK